MSPRSISCAIDTPSLVMVGEIRGLCNTTYRPLGPSVVLTASASLFTPATMDLRASVSKLKFLCATLPPFGRIYLAVSRQPLPGKQKPAARDVTCFRSHRLVPSAGLLYSRPWLS